MIIRDSMTLMVKAADQLKCYIRIRPQSITSQKTATFSVWYRGWEERNEGRRRRRRSHSQSSKKKICVLIDVAIPVDRKVIQKEAEKSKIQESKYRDEMNVEHATYKYTSNKWSHRNINKRFEEKFGSHARETFNRCTKKDSYTRKIKHNMESLAV